MPNMAIKLALPLFKHKLHMIKVVTVEHSRQLLVPISYSTCETTLRRYFVSQSSPFTEFTICFIRKNRQQHVTLERSSVILGSNDTRGYCYCRRSSSNFIQGHKIETLFGFWKRKGLNYYSHSSGIINTQGTAVRSLSNQSHVVHSKTNPPPSSASKDVCEDVYKKIVFMDDNIVAVNKPYGMSVFGSSQKQFEKFEECSEVSSKNVSLISILPQLSDKINSSELLDVGISLKSFYSGLVILSTHKESMNKLNKVIARCHTQKRHLMTYLAITVGEPQCPYGVDLTASIKRDWLHNREMSIVDDTLCRSACKKGTMMQTCFNIKPLAVNKSVGAALVQVTLNKDKWGAVEVLLSHYLSPVLGDHIYSSRTQIVAGVPCPASAHAAMPGTQRLPSTIQSLLKSSPDFVEDVASLFVHRHKVVLDHFSNRSSLPLVITAPPQKEFLAMLQCLGLYQDGMFS